MVANIMDKQKRIVNELRTLIKAPDECSDDQIIAITKGSFLRASVEFNMAVEELSDNVRKEFQLVEKYLSKASNAILKLQNLINKKS